MGEIARHGLIQAIETCLPRSIGFLLHSELFALVCIARSE
jgi:hypothetical protein